MPDPSRSIVDILNLSTDKCTAELKRRSDESGELELLAELGKTFGNAPTPAIIAKLVNFVKTCYPQAPRPIRTIGIYYFHMTIGGVQRVITSQFPIFKELGIKIVFFTDAHPEPNEYPLPDYVKRVWIPIPDATKPDFREQLAECAEIIKAENVDVFYNHHCSSITHLLWLSLVIKTAIKIPYFAHYHSVASFNIAVNRNYQYLATAGLLKMVELCLVMSRADQLYFSGCEINAVYMPNQYYLPDIKIFPKKQATGHTVLFLARIDPNKRPEDAVKTIEYVTEVIPDAKLLIVGSGWEKYENIVKEVVSNSKAAANIEYCGPTMNVADYYHRADVFLSTSKIEGFPVTLLEAQAFGVPVVCYDMPYLEIIRRPDNGIITVPQEAPAAAAEAIVKVLTEPELYRTKSQNGVATAKHFAEYNFKEQWQQLLANWSSLSKIESDPETLKIFLRTLHQHLYWNNAENQNQLKKLKSDLFRAKQEYQRNAASTSNEIKKLKSKYKRVTNGFSYRLGRTLTWIPRKIRGGVRCLKQHGVAYTCKRIFQKIGILFK